MTDFGANIFDDKQPPQGGDQPPKAPRPSRSKKARPSAADGTAPPAAAAAPAAALDQAGSSAPADLTDPAGGTKKPRTRRTRKTPADDQPAAEPAAAVAAPVDFGSVTFPAEPATSPSADDAPAAPTARAPKSGPRRRARSAEAPAPSNAAAPASAASEPTADAASQPPARPRQPRPRSRQVALLVDLDALQHEARQQGGELALTRLGTALAGGRPVHQALSFQAGRRPPVGFESQATDGQPATAAMRQVAFDLAKAARSEGSGLVLAPASDALLTLARELRAAGANVELAGFVVRDDDGQPTERLPRGCLFVP